MITLPPIFSRGSNTDPQWQTSQALFPTNKNGQHLYNKNKAPQATIAGEMHSNISHTHKLPSQPFYSFILSMPDQDAILRKVIYERYATNRNFRDVAETLAISESRLKTAFYRLVRDAADSRAPSAQKMSIGIPDLLEGPLFSHQTKRT